MKRLDYESFVQRAITIHGNLYSYPKFEYTNSRTRVPIFCHKHNGVFYQTPRMHLAGHGCNICNTRRSRAHKEDSRTFVLEGETWANIRGFEGSYQISNIGRLRSKLSGEWRIRSTINSKGDYLSVVLTDKGRRKSTRIHRLVYESFVGEIPKGYYVHHIDGNKQNNHVGNLKLVDPIEHSREHYIQSLEIRGADTSRTKNSYKYLISNGVVVGENPNYDIRHINDGAEKQHMYAKHRQILQCNMNGEVIARFETAREAYRATGVCSRNILQVANKTPFNDRGSIRKQAGGYIWKFVD